MNIIKARALRAHLQIANSLLAAVLTGVNLRIEASTSLTPEEIANLEAFWTQQLTNLRAEIETARRLTEKGGTR